MRVGLFDAVLEVAAEEIPIAGFCGFDLGGALVAVESFQVAVIGGARAADGEINQVGSEQDREKY